MDYSTNLENLDSTKKYWLDDAKNLVTSLSKVYGNITLVKLSQQFEAKTSFEKKLLGYDETLIRKITLSSSTEKLVFARTVIPQNTYAFFTAELNDLGTKPIGDNFLFDKNRFSRNDFIIRKLSRDVFEKEAAIDTHLFDDNEIENIYSRSSVFSFKENISLKMLITEYFIVMPETTNAN